MPSALIELRDIHKSFPLDGRTVNVLAGLDLTVHGGEFVAVMGPSGSGKSTLLHILGCLDRPDRGCYRLTGLDVLRAPDRQLSHIRASEIGFVFQTFNLVPYLNVYENVELPFLYSRVEAGRKKRILKSIERVGLAGRIRHRPDQLSGGEMQRAAIARALVVEPRLILADEPTGNLDAATGSGILDLLDEAHRRGTTIVLVTHDPEVAARARQVIEIEDGKIRASI